jgi:hypothetical protein
MLYTFIQRENLIKYVRYLIIKNWELNFQYVLNDMFLIRFKNYI